MWKRSLGALAMPSTYYIIGLAIEYHTNRGASDYSHTRIATLEIVPRSVNALLTSALVVPSPQAEISALSRSI